VTFRPLSASYQRAPTTDHPVVGDDPAAGMLDSPTRGGKRLPDPEFHDLSPTDALASTRPTE